MPKREIELPTLPCILADLVSFHVSGPLLPLLLGLIHMSEAEKH